MTVDEIQELTAIIAGFSQSLRIWANTKGVDLPPHPPLSKRRSAEENDHEAYSEDRLQPC